MDISKAKQSADTTGAYSSSPIPLTQTEVNNLSLYVPPTPGFFPVIAYGNEAYNPAAITRTSLELLFKSGINISAPMVYDSQSSIYADQQIEAVKDVVGKARDQMIRLMVRWKDYFATIPFAYKYFWNNVSENLADNATVCGWMPDSGGGTDAISNLGTIKGYIHDVYERCVYISMKTSKGFENSTSTATPFVWSGQYREYMLNVLRSFRPAVWVNRFEAFHTDIDDSSIRSGYFQNLEMFRRLAYATDRPWYATLKGSYSSGAQSGENGSELTEDRIKAIGRRYGFEMRSMLAFGARGVAWEGFFASDQTGYHDWAPVNKYGNKDEELFESCKSVNTEIAAVANIFLGESVRECRFSRSSSLSNGFTIGLSTPLGFLTSIEENTATRGFLLSQIVNFGEEYIVVMNIHPTETRSATLKFNKEVYRAYPVDLLSKKFTEYSLSLEPAEWIIFRKALCPDPVLSDLPSIEPASITE